MPTLQQIPLSCCIGLLSIALSSELSNAAEITPQAGLWAITSELSAEQKAAINKIKPNITMQTRQNGMRFDAQAGTITLEQCLDAAEIRQWQHLGQDPRLQCNTPRIKQSGQHISMGVECTQPKNASIHSEIELSANREHYQFEHIINTEGKEIRIKGHAQRLGDCP